ncbi:MAG: cupin domain-containing protein [Pseudoxanthomonas sp.]
MPVSFFVLAESAHSNRSPPSSRAPFAARIARVDKHLLGGLTAREFLRRHWQKAPLLVRQAVPGFAGLLDFPAMAAAAQRDDCESRLVLREGRNWSVEQGPFPASRLRRLPARGWTLLVQGVEQFSDEARRLLARFDFIPTSRLDDLMVSFAPDGGGVGPHFDSYDVFLLQGPGTRRWRVSRQRDLALRENAPLKILRRFRAQGEALLSPGDMLYLPPQYAHEGVAVGDCYTYSIGFRAPSHRELASEFLMFLEERLRLPGRYADPDLLPQEGPARIAPATVERIRSALQGIRWNRADIVAFIGSYLTEPKAQVRFSPPGRPLATAAFARAARRDGVRLVPASQMLYADSHVFINGESVPMPKSAGVLRRLADSRHASAPAMDRDRELAGHLYQWYRAGYICLDARSR